MDVLKNKSYYTFEYTSRYSTVPYYFHSSDKKYVFGLISNLKQSIIYLGHKVTMSDTLDNLALAYYNDPTLYWVIAMYNDIQDCFKPLYGNYKSVKIPKISAVEYGDRR